MAKKKIVDSAAKKRLIDPEALARALDADRVFIESGEDLRITISSSMPIEEEIVIPRLTAQEAAKKEYSCIGEGESAHFDHCLSMAMSYGDNVFRRAVGFTIDKGKEYPIWVRFYEKVATRKNKKD